MKHMTLNAAFVLWVGESYETSGHALFYMPEEEHRRDLLKKGIAKIGGYYRVCDMVNDFGGTIPVRDILEQVPTCPMCAVLYDMAMEQREEELERRRVDEERMQVMMENHRQWLMHDEIDNERFWNTLNTGIPYKRLTRFDFKLNCKGGVDCPTTGPCPVHG